MSALSKNHLKKQQVQADSDDEQEDDKDQVIEYDTIDLTEEADDDDSQVDKRSLQTQQKKKEDKNAEVVFDVS